MHLGAFSMSLAVKDVGACVAFDTALGFKVFHDQPANHCIIMQNGDSAIGFLEGVFDGNILASNQAWDHHAKTVEPFDDMRSIQPDLQAKGNAKVREADDTSAEPASCVVVDPEGNTILIDQHR